MNINKDRLSSFDTDDALILNESRRDFLQGFLPELIRENNLSTALDVGCGYGFYSNCLKENALEVRAFDAREDNIQEARRRYPNIEFNVSDVEDRSCTALGSFDLVLCFGLLYHLENPFMAIRNLFNLAGKYLLIETMVIPKKGPFAKLFTEPKSENQSLHYSALIPSEDILIKMLHIAGFKSVYKADDLPAHEQFHTSTRRLKARTVLLASKEECLEEIAFKKIRFHKTYGLRCQTVSLRTWDTPFFKFLNSINCLIKQIIKKPSIFLLKKAPLPLIIKISSLLSKGMPLKNQQGWHLGAGQYSARRFSAVYLRLLLWKEFSARSEKEKFIIRWHDGIRLYAYPKVETCQSLSVTGYYEPNMLIFLKEVLASDMTFIDIGANMGLYSIFASKIVGEGGKVLAFEPSKRECSRFKENLRLNNMKNIFLSEIALSDKKVDRELLIADEEHSGHNTLGSFIYPETNLRETVKIKTDTLDALIKKKKLSSVNVIKIDTEGHEYSVLNGALETLQRFKPTLLVEIEEKSLQVQGSSKVQIADLLSSLGYKIYCLDPLTGEQVALDQIYFDSGNIIAINKD